MSNDILMLHIQFLIAMLALSLISLLLVICIYRYMSYREYRGDLDALTGVMGRRMFTYQQEMKVLMSWTDELLYQAKSIGRACYVIGTEIETTAGGPRLNVAVD